MVYWFRTVESERVSTCNFILVPSCLDMKLQRTVPQAHCQLYHHKNGAFWLHVKSPYFIQNYLHPACCYDDGESSTSMDTHGDLFDSLLRNKTRKKNYIHCQTGKLWAWYALEYIHRSTFEITA